MENNKVIGTATLFQTKIVVPIDFQEIVSHLEDVNKGKAEIRVDFCESDRKNYCIMIFSLVGKTGEETKILDGGMYPYWRWPAIEE